MQVKGVSVMGEEGLCGSVPIATKADSHLIDLRDFSVRQIRYTFRENIIHVSGSIIIPNCNLVSAHVLSAIMLYSVHTPECI